MMWAVPPPPPPHFKKLINTVNREPQGSGLPPQEPLQGPLTLLLAFPKGSCRASLLALPGPP